jgi:hypothetical protein
VEQLIIATYAIDPAKVEKLQAIATAFEKVGIFD